MHFSSLELQFFRNYDSIQIEFGPGINCLTGNNGEGKTNVLEALHFLAMTRGWSAKGEKYAIQEDAPWFSVEGKVEGDPGFAVQCNFVPGKGKKMLVGGRVLPRMSDHIGRIPLIVVLPGDTELITGTPSVRRKFVDSFISQYNPGYLKALIKYEKARSQRDALLSRFLESGRFDPAQLEPWDLQLAQHGQVLFAGRRDFLTEYREPFGRYFKDIVSDKESPTIDHESHLDKNTPEEWAQLFRARRDKDRYAGRTTGGVHRDEFAFRIDGQPVRNFGSQGQQKTFVISLKFAQYELLASHAEQSPILLLDDIFDKLDVHRLGSIARILDTVIQGQVFITDTTFSRTKQVFDQVKNREIRYFRVHNRTVKPIDPHE